MIALFVPFFFIWRDWFYFEYVKT